MIINPIVGKANFVCSDQAIIDDGISLGYQGSFSIGTQTDADQILATNQQSLLAQNSNQFNVNKDIDSDLTQTTWITCDLNTEPDNDNIDYNVFNPLDGTYTLSTGLNNAKQTETNIKQQYLAFYSLSSYQTWDTWKPLPKNNTTIGTQTL
jgi:hypothetical protein